MLGPRPARDGEDRLEVDGCRAAEAPVVVAREEEAQERAAQGWAPNLFMVFVGLGCCWRCSTKSGSLGAAVAAVGHEMAWVARGKGFGSDAGARWTPGQLMADEARVTHLFCNRGRACPARTVLLDVRTRRGSRSRRGDVSRRRRGRPGRCASRRRGRAETRQLCAGGSVRLQSKGVPLTLPRLVFTMPRVRLGWHEPFMIGIEELRRPQLPFAAGSHSASAVSALPRRS